MGRISAMRMAGAALLVGLAAGCGGGGAYLETDVAEVSGFRQVSAKDVRMSGGVMHSGTLEYAGSGDLGEVFRSYYEEMRAQGWSIVQADVVGDRAVGKLRKDNRDCNLVFVKSRDGIKATIEVALAK